MYTLSLSASSGYHLAQDFINPIQFTSYWTFAVFGDNGVIKLETMYQAAFTIGVERLFFRG